MHNVLPLFSGFCKSCCHLICSLVHSLTSSSFYNAFFVDPWFRILVYILLSSPSLDNSSYNDVFIVVQFSSFHVVEASFPYSVFTVFILCFVFYSSTHGTRKARFPLPELTARVNGPSWRVTGFHYPSTRAVLTGARFPLAELTGRPSFSLNIFLLTLVYCPLLSLILLPNDPLPVAFEGPELEKHGNFRRSRVKSLAKSRNEWRCADDYFQVSCTCQNTLCFTCMAGICELSR